MRPAAPEQRFSKRGCVKFWSQYGSTVTSSSVKTIARPRAAAIPALRAFESPCLLSNMYRKRPGNRDEYCSTTSFVLSLELLSTTNISQSIESSSREFAMLCKALPKLSHRLYVHRMIEIAIISPCRRLHLLQQKIGHS